MRSHKAGRYTFQTILMQKLNCIVKLIFVDILAISHFKCMVRKCKSLEKTTKRSCFASQAVNPLYPLPPLHHTSVGIIHYLISKRRFLCHTPPILQSPAKTASLEVSCCIINDKNQLYQTYPLDKSNKRKFTF